MAYRFTNTEKWRDSWFSNLKQLEMLLFIYLCDNCDIAGFIEMNIKLWAFDLNSSPDTILRALEGLKRGIIISNEGDCLFVRNFLKHQKNLPLNKNNNAHIGIIKRFELYKHKFDIKEIDDFISSPYQGADEGLNSPIGNGKGKGKGKECINSEKIEEREIAFKNTLLPYISKYNEKMCNDFFNYWSERDQFGTKMRFEMQKTWEVGKRLATWASKCKFESRQTTATAIISQTKYKQF